MAGSNRIISVRCWGIKKERYGIHAQIWKLPDSSAYQTWRFPETQRAVWNHVEKDLLIDSIYAFLLLILCYLQIEFILEDGTLKEMDGDLKKIGCSVVVSYLVWTSQPYRHQYSRFPLKNQGKLPPPLQKKTIS